MRPARTRGWSRREEGYTPQHGDTFPEPLHWITLQNQTSITLLIPVIGDINGDGGVNVADLLLLLAFWGTCPECPADLDGNGEVNVTDLLLLLSNFDIA